MTGALAMGTNKITGLGTPSAGTDAVNKAYVDAGGSGGNKLNLSGGTMSGVIAMGANKITGVSNPTQAQDASTKGYTDTLFGSTAAAATSAAAANTSAGNAATSATSSANSATSAAASFDSFDDRYLGAKASDPSTDNDGNALVVGAMYFNATSNNMKVWSGSAWLIMSPTASQQTNIDIVAGDLIYTEDLGSITAAITTGSGNSISIVGAAIANVNTVAGAVANVNTVGAAIANVNTVGSSIANVNTVAGSIADVNRYANEYKISSSAPAGPSSGDLWYDSTANVLKYYTGSAFSGIISGITSVAADSSPQLGGALDGQNNNMTNIGTISGSNLQMDFGGLS